MKKLKSYLKPVFVTKEITDLNLLYFTEDHINKLTQMNTGGSYDSLINRTSLIYYEFLEEHKKKETVKSTKQEKTKTVVYLLEETKEDIRKLEAYLRFTVGKKSNEYNSLFPEGLSEFGQLNYSNIEDKMTRILVFLRKNTSIVSQDVINEIENTYLLYQKERKKQLHKKDEYKSNLKSKDKLRKQLGKNLQINLYHIAIEYIGKIEMIDSFFTEKLLFSRRVKRTDFYKKNRFSEVNLNI